VRNTVLDLPFNAKTDRFETLSKILVHDSDRNNLIIHDITQELKAGRRCVVLTERKEHINALEQYMKQSFETVALSGDDTENSRNSKWKLLKSGNYQVLITTGQFFGEGSDLQNLECLFLVYPFSFEGKLIQYLGRVQRSEICPTIYDYRDIRIECLNRMFLKRNVYYRKLERHRTLFDLPTEDSLNSKHVQEKEIIIEKSIKSKISELEFLWGSVRFQHSISEHPKPLTFEPENEYMRPEFEVLKPYIEKKLHSKTINCQINVVIDLNKQITGLLAASADLDQFNREVIESVRFEFVDRNLIRKAGVPQSDLQESGDLIANGLYESGQELLTDILSRGNYLHEKQLMYLAEHHKGTLLKIRFILSPFAFLFLLEGPDRHHLVMETLDTAEATYVWHLPHGVGELKATLRDIDGQLNQIRNEGRQKFLESNPVNFRKVLHDYTDGKKGFIVWRDLIEERLF
jgi:hypothetical protein